MANEIVVKRITNEIGIWQATRVDCRITLRRISGYYIVRMEVDVNIRELGLVKGLVITALNFRVTVPYN